LRPRPELKSHRSGWKAAKPMRIQYERSGGFGGIAQRYSVSLDALDEEERQKLVELISGAHFFELPAEIHQPEPHPDQFHYKISVESDQGTHEVRFSDPVPAQLQPVVNWLKAAARKH